MNKRRKLARFVCASSALLFGLGMTLDATAKLSVPYGEDGAPPDSETQAEVDALNEALEGPEEGQTWVSWEAELQAAYNDLHDVHSGADSFVAVSSQDLCEDPLGLWVLNASGETIASVVGQPDVRSELIDELETMLHWILAMETAGTDLEFDRPSITALRCDQCEMTYAECLQVGNSWEFCKRRYLTCSKAPESSLSISLSVTSPVSGQITASGTANSEVWSYGGQEYPNFCFNVHDYEFEGFGAVTEALIRANVDRFLGDGHFCLYDY